MGDWRPQETTPRSLHVDTRYFSVPQSQAKKPTSMTKTRHGMGSYKIESEGRKTTRGAVTEIPDAIRSAGNLEPTNVNEGRWSRPAGEPTEHVLHPPSTKTLQLRRQFHPGE